MKIAVAGLLFLLDHPFVTLSAGFFSSKRPYFVCDRSCTGLHATAVSRRGPADARCIQPFFFSSTTSPCPFSPFLHLCLALEEQWPLLRCALCDPRPSLHSLHRSAGGSLPFLWFHTRARSRALSLSPPPLPLPLPLCPPAPLPGRMALAA